MSKTRDYEAEYVAYNYGYAAARGDSEAEALFKQKYAGIADAEAEYQRGYNSYDAEWEAAEREFPNASDREIVAILEARATTSHTRQ
jgi:hypothetical protein